MNHLVQRIVIVGGGAAGWLTAGVIAAEHCTDNTQGITVTLIESPDVPTIGVGEGTWPSMRTTLKKIGVSETDFIRQCDASFKQGSKFARWVTGKAEDYYYHPFSPPYGYGRIDLARYWRQEKIHHPFADFVSYQPQLCENNKAPKQISTPEYSAVANYAYHLDAIKFGVFLRQHCMRQLGVQHIVDHVQAIIPAHNGNINALKTHAHGTIAGDLFIDCTGFASLLLGQHYQIPLLSQCEILFNNTALALPVDYQDEQGPIISHTISTAQKAGWIWDIGLPTRRGIGYVYANAYTSDSEAEETLMRYIAHIPNHQLSDRTPRKIAINPGYRKTFWHKNCVAVGMAAGFIEPLEASALALIELSAAMISSELPATQEVMGIIAKRYNTQFHYKWERIIDFLKLHYVLSQRTDSDYWIDHRHNIPTRLQESIKWWRYRAPSRYDFYQIEEIFPALSYQYILHGMGFSIEQSPGQKLPNDQISLEQGLQECSHMRNKLMAQLPTTRELINQIQQHALQPI